MHIIIDRRSGVHMRTQIVSNIKRMVVSGELNADDALPSIRSLATELGVSFITTKGAYEELENLGIIYTIPGKGSYVARLDKQMIREERTKDVEGYVNQAADISKEISLSADELKEMVDFFMEENNEFAGN